MRQGRSWECDHVTHPTTLVTFQWIMFRSLSQSYLRLLRNHTLITQILTAGTIFPLGDSVAQHAIERRRWRDHDSRSEMKGRTLRFSFYGAILWAPIANRWHRFLNSINLSTKFKTIAARGLLERRSLDEIKQTIRRNHFHVTAVNMMVFGPAQIINMSSIPLYARPPFLNCVALGYNCFLATINRKDKMTTWSFWYEANTIISYI
ncbi:hypothetical protein BY996DRAFT_2415631 [Phakopsora pachyrhizi]|nr:hypothetical protein BY996DRAFT_2415631 [Phakopsora pachyrhizi]